MSSALRGASLSALLQARSARSIFRERQAALPYSAQNTATPGYCCVNFSYRSRAWAKFPERRSSRASLCFFCKSAGVMNRAYSRLLGKPCTQARSAATLIKALTNSPVSAIVHKTHALRKRFAGFLKTRSACSAPKRQKIKHHIYTILYHENVTSWFQHAHAQDGMHCISGSPHAGGEPGRNCGDQFPKQLLWRTFVFRCDRYRYGVWHRPEWLGEFDADEQWLQLLLWPTVL